VVRELAVPSTNVSTLILWLVTRQRNFTTATRVDDVLDGITTDLHRLLHRNAATISYYPCATSGPYPQCPASVSGSALYRHVTSSPQFAVDASYPLTSTPGSYASTDRRFSDQRTYWWLRAVSLGNDEHESRLNNASLRVTLSSACKYVSVSTPSTTSGQSATTSGSHHIVICLELTQPHCTAQRVDASLWGQNQSQFPFQVPQNSFAVVAFVEKVGGLVGVQAWDHGRSLELPPNVSSVVDVRQGYCYSVCNRHRISLGRVPLVTTSDHLEQLSILHNATLEDVQFDVSEWPLDELSTFLTYRGWSQEIKSVVVDQVQDVFTQNESLHLRTKSSSESFSSLSAPQNAPVVFRPSANNGACVATYVTFVAPRNLAIVMILENNDGLGGYNAIERYIGYTQAAAVIVIVAGCYLVVHWLTKPLFQLKASMKRREAVDDAADATAVDKPLSSASSAASVVVPPSSSHEKTKMPSGPLSFVAEFSDVAIAFFKVRRLARERVTQLRLVAHRREHQEEELAENESALPYRLHAGQSVDSRATDARNSSLAQSQRRSKSVAVSGQSDAEVELSAPTTQSMNDDPASLHDGRTTSRRVGDDDIRTAAFPRTAKKDIFRKGMSLECVSPTSGGDISAGVAPLNITMTRYIMSHHSHNTGQQPPLFAPHGAAADGGNNLPGSPLSGSQHCCALEPFPSEVVVLMVISFPHCRLEKLAHEMPWSTAATTQAWTSSFKSAAAASTSTSGGPSHQSVVSPPPGKQPHGKQLPPPSISPFEYLGMVLRIVALHNGVVETISSHQRIVVSFSSASRNPDATDANSSPLTGAKNAVRGAGPPTQQPVQPSLRHIHVLPSGNSAGLSTPTTMVDPLAPPPPFMLQPQQQPMYHAASTSSPATHQIVSQNSLAAISALASDDKAPPSEPLLADEALVCATSIVKAMHDVFFHAAHDWVEAQAVHLVHTNVPQESANVPIVTVTLDASAMFLGTVHLPATTTITTTEHQTAPPAAASSHNNSGGVGGSGSLRQAGSRQAITPSPRHSSHNHHQVFDGDVTGLGGRESKNSTRQTSNTFTTTGAKPAIEYYLVGDAMDRADGLCQLQQLRHPRCTIICTDHFRKQLSSYLASVQLRGDDQRSDGAAGATPPPHVMDHPAAAHPPFVPIDVMRASLQTIGIPRTDTVVVFAVVDPVCVAMGERKTLSVEREPRAAAELLSRILAVFTPNSPLSDVLDAIGGGHHQTIDAAEKIRSTLDLQVLPRALSLHDLLRLLIVAAQAPHALFDESSASSPPRGVAAGNTSRDGGQFQSPPTHFYPSSSGGIGSSSSSSASTGLLVTQRQSILQFVMRTYFPLISKLALSAPLLPRERHSNYRANSAHLLAAALPAFMHDIAEHVLLHLVPPQSSASTAVHMSSSSAAGSRLAHRHQSSLTATNVPALVVGGDRAFPMSPLGGQSNTAQNRYGSVSFASMQCGSDPPTPTAGANHQHGFSSTAMTSSISMSGGPPVTTGPLAQSLAMGFGGQNPLMWQSGSMAMPSGNFTSSGSISAPPAPANGTSSSSISGPQVTTNPSSGSIPLALPGVAVAPGSATHVLLEMRDTPTPLPNTHALLTCSTSTFANPPRHSSSNLYSAKVQRTWENLEGLPAEALQLW
jgi:hypothetical protein